MKKLILVAAFAALCPALAQAQSSGGDCNALRNSANVGAGAQWTADQAKPYMDKMAAMNMKTKTEGTFTDEDFNTACQAGAFKDMK